MNRIYPLISLTVLALFAGCGSVDHDAPELKTNDLGEVSPFDTLQVTFDKDIFSFDDSVVTSSSPVSVLKVSGSSVYVVGDDTTLSGLPVFKAGISRNTITFSAVRDEDGNKSGEQHVTFATYPILDNDGGSSCSDNGTPKTAEALADSAKFFDQTDFDDGLTFAALLSADYNDDCPDTYDYFRVYLRAKDSLFIKMTGNSAPLSVLVKGPQIMEGETGKTYQTVYEFDATSKKPSVDTSVYISADIHMYGTTDMTEYLAYYIEVTYPSSTPLSTDPVPYVLTVRRSEK